MPSMPRGMPNMGGMMPSTGGPSTADAHALIEDAHSKKRRESIEMLDQVLDVLRGNNLNMMLGVGTFAFALGVTIFSLLHLSLSHFQKCFTLLAVLFLITQSFTMVESMRNGALTQPNLGEGKDQEKYYERFLMKGAAFIKGHNIYRASVVAGFFIAIACSVYGLFIMPAAMDQESVRHLPPGKCLLFLGAFFTLGSSLNLANLLRDRFDAEIWAKQFHDNPQMPMEMIEVCLKNSCVMASKTLAAMKGMFGILTLCSLLLTLYAFFTFGIKNGRGFVGAGFAFLMVTTWYLAKAVEDDDNDSENNHALPALGTFVLALGLVVFGLTTMIIPWIMRLTLLFGMVFTTNSFFNLAKNINRAHRIELIEHMVEEDTEKRQWATGGH